MERECFWVNLREDNKVSESKMAVSESNMAEFKMAAIIKLSQNEMSEVEFLCKMAESKMAEFKMVAIIKLIRWNYFESQSQSGGRVFLSELREDNKVFESKMAVSESNMAEFKMAAIINLSENEWVKFFLYKMAELRMADVQDICNHQVESEWMNEVFLCKCW